MSKRLLVVGIVLVAIVGGIIYLAISPNVGPAKEQMTNSTPPAVPPDPQPTLPAQAPTAPGTYSDYQPGVIASTTGTKLLFFHAPWCPQCRALEADIKQKGVPSDVTIFKVDYDTSQTLRKQYGVTLQTTLVRVDDAGTLIKKFVAYDEPTIDSVVRNLL